MLLFCTNRNTSSLSAVNSFRQHMSRTRKSYRMTAANVRTVACVCVQWSIGLLAALVSALISPMDVNRILCTNLELQFSCCSGNQTLILFICFQRAVIFNVWLIPSSKMQERKLCILQMSKYIVNKYPLKYIH